MKPGQPTNEPKPEEAVQRNHYRSGLGADSGADIRRRFPWFPAPSETCQPCPADELHCHAERRGRGDEEQEEAVVSGLVFGWWIFVFFNEKSEFFILLVSSSSLPKAVSRSGVDFTRSFAGGKGCVSSLAVSTSSERILPLRKV